jgi:hypothetical protein
VGCSRPTREAPEERTDSVEPERLPLAPEVAPPIEQQDAEREHALRQDEEARGMQQAPAEEQSDVVGGAVGAESGKVPPCEEEQGETASAEGAGRAPGAATPTEERTGLMGAATPSDQSAREKGRQLVERMEAAEDPELREGAPIEGGLGEGSASSVVPLVPSGVGAERGEADTRVDMPSDPSSSLSMQSRSTLRGQVLYGGPSLPEEAQIRVALVGTGSGVVLAEQVMAAEGEPPYAFALDVPGATDDLSNYSVRVTIEDDGQVLYSTLGPYQTNMAEGSVLPVQVLVP